LDVTFDDFLGELFEDFGVLAEGVIEGGLEHVFDGVVLSFWLVYVI
jgi:hypothetical protein